MEGVMINMSELLRGARPGRDEEGARRPLPEAQIATLREAAARYAAPCPFKPGDLVTPRKGFRYFDAGVPHIVLEVASEPIRNWPVDETGSSGFGNRLDVRVANFSSDGTVVSFWQESWCLELYVAQA